MKINGPDAKTIIKMVADEFLSRKKCNNVDCRSSEDIMGNVVVTGDDVNIEVGVGSNEADEVGGERNKDNEGRDTDEVSEDEDKMKSMKK